MTFSKYAVCICKKLRFIKEEDASRLLKNLFLENLFLKKCLITDLPTWLNLYWKKKF